MLAGAGRIRFLKHQLRWLNLGREFIEVQGTEYVGWSTSTFPLPSPSLRDSGTSFLENLPLGSGQHPPRGSHRAEGQRGATTSPVGVEWSGPPRGLGWREAQRRRWERKPPNADPKKVRASASWRPQEDVAASAWPQHPPSPLPSLVTWLRVGRTRTGGALDV